MGRGDLDLFVSDTAWPRAFFTDRVATYNSLDDFISQIQAGDGRPFAAVERGDIAGISGPSNLSGGELSARHVVSATDYALTNNNTTFKVEAPGKGVVVLGEAYLAGDFKVTVNGRPSDYFRVNHMFKGIAVNEAGSYTVTFSYWPKYLSLSLWMSVVGLLAMIAWVGYEYGTRPKPQAVVRQGAKRQNAKPKKSIASK